VNGILEAKPVKEFAIDRFVVHAEHFVVITAAPNHPLGRRHEYPLGYGNVLFGKKRSKGFRLHAYRFVRFIKNCQIECRTAPFGRLNQPVTGLIGGEDDLFPFIPVGDEGGDFFNSRSRRNPHGVCIGYELILIQICRRFIAAYHQPFRPMVFIVGKKLSGPVFQPLLDQRQAGDGDNDRPGFQDIGNPVGGQTFTRTARHDQAPSAGIITDEMFDCLPDGFSLMLSRHSGDGPD